MANFGSTPEGGLNAFTKAFKSDPSIKNYVKLRRENPDAEIEVAVIGGLDTVVYMEDDLSKHQIEPELVLKALNADRDAISELALLLMERIIGAKELAAEGETHLVVRGRAIPDKLIDWLITCCLHALSWNGDLRIPRDLIVLIRERLGGQNAHFVQAAHAHSKKEAAPFLAGLLLSHGEEPTYKTLGELLEVHHITVRRWLKPGELYEKADWWTRRFDVRDELPPGFNPDPDDTSSA